MHSSDDGYNGLERSVAWGCRIFTPPSHCIGDAALRSAEEPARGAYSDFGRKSHAPSALAKKNDQRLILAQRESRKAADLTVGLKGQR